MNIYRSSISNGTVDRAQQSQGTDEARNAEQSRLNAANDAISLSSAARDVERISDWVEQSRTDRLNQVREAISNGTYRVSGQDIALKLIELNER